MTQFVKFGSFCCRFLESFLPHKASCSTLCRVTRLRWHERRLEEVKAGVARAARGVARVAMRGRGHGSSLCQSVASRRLGASNTRPVRVGASAAPLDVMDRPWCGPSRATNDAGAHLRPHSARVHRCGWLKAASGRQHPHSGLQLRVALHSETNFTELQWGSSVRNPAAPQARPKKF